MRTFIARSSLAAAVFLTPVPVTAAEALKARALSFKHGGEIYSIDVSADSRIAITTSVKPFDTNTNEVKVWDIASGKLLLSDDNVTGEPPYDIVSGHPVRSETAGAGRQLHLAETGQLLAKLSQTESIVAIVGSGAALKVIAIQSGAPGEDLTEDETVRIHDAATGAVDRTFKLAGTAAGGGNRHARVDADGRWLAYAIKDAVAVVDLASGRLQSKPLTGANDKPPAIGLARDGTILFTLDANRQLASWAVPDLQPAGKPVVISDAEPSWYELFEVKRGDLLRMEGTRATGFADLKTGKVYWAARGSSVNRFLLTSIDDSLILRGSRSRSNPTMWGVIRHANGGFKELYITKGTIALGSLVTSPNGRCLTLLAGRTLSIVEPASRKELGSVKGLPDKLYRGIYTPDGAQFIVTGEDGDILTIATPKACR